jgi:hypothetical protein
MTQPSRSRTIIADEIGRLKTPHPVLSDHAIRFEIRDH